MKRVKIHPRRGTHLTTLLRAVRATTGPIWEFGAGLYSTPFLHAISEIDDRPLVTYENSPGFHEWASHFATELHRVELVTDWDSLDLSNPCSVAFIDHAPGDRRQKEMARLLHAEYVVAHDIIKNIGKTYEEIYPLFRYRRKNRRKNTVALSNLHPLNELW